MSKYLLVDFFYLIDSWITFEISIVDFLKPISHNNMPKQGMSSVDKTSSASSNGDTSAKNCSSWNRNISYDFKIYDGKFLFLKSSFEQRYCFMNNAYKMIGKIKVPWYWNSFYILCLMRQKTLNILKMNNQHQKFYNIHLNSGCISVETNQLTFLRVMITNIQLITEGPALLQILPGSI